MPPSSPTTPVKVTTFPVVRHHIIPTAICAVIMILSSRRDFIQPGSPIHSHILAPLASLTGTTLASAEATAATVQTWTFRILVDIHALEVPIFAATKLPAHGVAFLSGLWWKWVLAVFFGGKFTWDLFAETVRGAKAKGR
ncbi:hypothetical protein M406DRAFT_349817 [Cryphonectria parasitica EP155]|uniref:Uncharacterized protein n=1 Tax=Cryphonectria parasitica (strain ATCC 38755 / EP155) TaxID=660469 RepID=A0A9P4Y8F9_CRYP1|nr:uncharacterized protein M406DRAFT_349817 [Cryphonectria parasitica EP155]KAF3768661.1 hypothetical protein M406DRAFT_349817 [Cryphonectria parasitica EP155]